MFYGPWTITMAMPIFQYRFPRSIYLKIFSSISLREFVENSRHPKTPAREREGLIRGS